MNSLDEDDEDAQGLNLALSGLGLGAPPGAMHDSFYTPQNQDFYRRFKYRPLNRKRRHIRLLKVFFEEKTFTEHLADHPHWKASLVDDTASVTVSRAPSPHVKLIGCEIVNGVSLASCAGRYAALSYAAGDAANTDVILVNGYRFKAFAQLVHALKCAVHNRENYDEAVHSDHLLIWVDQVCINQADPEERGHQVTMMRDIYSHGFATLVCLSVKYKEQMVFVDGGWASRPCVNGLQWVSEVKVSKSLVDHFWEICSNTSSDLLLKLDSFLVFLECPWWTRSWVYQEFFCSPEVYFLFENDSQPYEKVLACLGPETHLWGDDWTSRLKSKSFQDIASVKDAELSREREMRRSQEGRPRLRIGDKSFSQEVQGRVDELVQVLSKGDVRRSMRTVSVMINSRSQVEVEQRDLRILLRHARNFRASDARDKIYAFVGLAREEYGFAPSYLPGNTAVHVYSDAARRILEHDGDLTYLLEQAYVGRRDLGLFFLPSWVPDWNCHENKDVLLELQQHASTTNESDRAQASSDVQAPDKKKLLDLDVHDMGGGRFKLQLTGRRIATIAGRGKAVSQKVRQFETDSGVVVFADRAARAKDEIWSISGCKWHVFLRHEEGADYHFGGIVVIRPLGDGVVIGPEGKPDRLFLI